MDVLSDILRTVKMTGTLYFATQLSPPWGIRVPPFQRVARFHLAIRGSASLSVEGRPEPLMMEPGSVVLIPHGREHSLSDHPDTPCLLMDEVVEKAGFTGKGALLYGGEDHGTPTRLVCGHFAFDENIEHPFFEQLPDVILIHQDDMGTGTQFDDAFRFVSREILSGLPGADSVIVRLSEILFIQIIRVWAARESVDSGILAALADRNISDALAAIHESPAHSWTLETLARTAGLSRTSFSTRFRELVGMPPKRYVTFWRIQRARELLTRPHLTMDDVAENVGYKSVPAFSQVFREWVGESPGAYRRRVTRARAADPVHD